MKFKYKMTTETISINCRELKVWKRRNGKREYIANIRRILRHMCIYFTFKCSVLDIDWYSVSDFSVCVFIKLTPDKLFIIIAKCILYYWTQLLIVNWRNHVTLHNEIFSLPDSVTHAISLITWGWGFSFFMSSSSESRSFLSDSGAFSTWGK